MSLNIKTSTGLLNISGVDLSPYATIEQLNNKANTNHGHIIDDVTDLQIILDDLAKASDIPTTSEIIDLVYPVGAIYLTVNETSPAMLFGGTWEQIKDTFLLASGSTYIAGSTGGEAKHSLTIAEMPKHNHIIALQDQDGGTLGTTCTAILREAYEVHDTGWGDTSMVWNTGGSQAHNNMPPYLAVYMYKRVE